jgi:hypothetical protein
VTPAATDDSSRVAERRGAYCSVKQETHFGYSFKGPWMIVCIATDVPTVLGHLKKGSRRELIMTERRETDDIITLPNVDVKFIA